MEASKDFLHKLVAPSDLSNPSSFWIPVRHHFRNHFQSNSNSNLQNTERPCFSECRRLCSSNIKRSADLETPQMVSIHRRLILVLSSSLWSLFNIVNHKNPVNPSIWLMQTFSAAGLNILDCNMELEPFFDEKPFPNFFPNLPTLTFVFISHSVTFPLSKSLFR